MSDLVLSYYADDFTGATDALEVLSRAGIRTVLFLEPPTRDQLAAFPGLQAVGVAGMTRTMAPAEIERTLRPALSALRDLGARHVHYKVCSTFDSSPTVGSIGRAIDVGAEVFAAPFVPLVVGAPALGRYCLFGNLFARMGIGSSGGVYRLDRHPSMSRHPVTPSDEADLRVHLGRQTAKRIGLFDILHVESPAENRRGGVQQLIADGNDVVLFDVLEERDLAAIGELLDGYATPGEPLFSVGSSGVDMALSMHWAATGRIKQAEPRHRPTPASPLLVASGSCSPVTAGQIAHALATGFAEVPLDPLESSERQRVQQVAAAASGHLAVGRSVLIHTGPRLEQSDAPSANLGTAVGEAVRLTLQQTAVPRMCVAGGDTSSRVARALGIEALEMVAPLTPGAPLCRARAPGSPADGVEFVFKGGQVGGEDYFSLVAGGGP